MIFEGLTSLLTALEVLDSVVISMLDCQSRGWGFKSLAWQKFCMRFLLHLHP